MSGQTASSGAATGRMQASPCPCPTTAICSTSSWRQARMNSLVIESSLKIRLNSTVGRQS